MSFFNNISGIYVERKKRTKFLNIEKMIDIPYIKIPLKGDLEKIIEIGEYVKKGQVIARGKISPSIHSPISGFIDEIINYNGIREGYKELIIIKNDYSEQALDVNGFKKYDTLKPEDFFELIKEKGIVGMGGGAYPTYLKLKSAFEKGVDTLVVNACECEAYLTCDDRLVQEKAKEIIEGINILIKVLNINLVVIAVEDNKKEAILELKKVIKISKRIKVVELRKKYPLGEERLLLKELFGKEVPKDRYPVDYGYVVQNVGTIFAIYEAVLLDKGLIDRIVTISGAGVKEPKNLKVKIGTSINDIKEYLKNNENIKKIILGGPMTGFSNYDGTALIEKNHGALLFLNEEEINLKKTEVCINCGICVNKCPMGLLPLRFEEFLQEQEWDELINFNLMDCIECGICTYVCPSNRPLVESIILAKKMINEVKNVE